MTGLLYVLDQYMVASRFRLYLFSFQILFERAKIKVGALRRMSCSLNTETCRQSKVESVNHP